MARLCSAQILVHWVPFHLWRGTLGSTAGAGRGSAELAGLSRQLAADVEWAARRLPVPTKCLPRAMALSWMLRRKRIDHTVVIAVRPRELRKLRDSLHAWVEVDDEKILGDLSGPWIETFRTGV